MNGAGFRFAALSAVLALSGCVRATLAWADLSGEGPDAAPSIEAPRSVEEWEQIEAPRLRTLLAAHVYGKMPDASAVRIIETRTIDAAAFGGLATIEERTLVATARFGEIERDTTPFVVTLAFPNASSSPSPIIIMETFCSRRDTIPHPDVSWADSALNCSGGGLISALMTYVFGRYIATPPVEEILRRGYAIAALFPGEAAPDSKEEGVAALAALAPDVPEASRWGAIAVWGWMFSRAVDAVAEDARIDQKALIVWGHSRYAKAALVAAATDPRIDAVIAHQAGTGGAALSRHKVGESVGDITRSYPHWFSQAFAAAAGNEDALPVDQHYLLALIAPRPIFLGNARRDVWSDPNGTFRAAKGATPAYAIYGSTGLEQSRLDEFRPAADIAFWIRPGTHGVVEEDWPAFLSFLDARFKRL